MVNHEPRTPLTHILTALALIAQRQHGTFTKQLSETRKRKKERRRHHQSSGHLQSEPDVGELIRIFSCVIYNDSEFQGQAPRFSLQKNTNPACVCVRANINSICCFFLKNKSGCEEEFSWGPSAEPAAVWAGACTHPSERESAQQHGTSADVRGLPGD